MKRSALVIAATATGLALTLSFRPHTGATPMGTLASLTTGTPGVAGAQTVVGSDQQLAGGLGDIQVKVTAKNGKLVNVGMAKDEPARPPVAADLDQRDPAAGAAHDGRQRRTHPGRLRRYVHEPSLRALAAGGSRPAQGRTQCKHRSK